MGELHLAVPDGATRVPIRYPSIIGVPAAMVIAEGRAGRSRPFSRSLRLDRPGGDGWIMDHETLVLHLEELVRSLREDPIFPWRIGTKELFARINEACTELGLEPPILFEWNPERGLAKFGVRTLDRTVSLPPMDPLSPQAPLHGFAACANWWVPEVVAADGEVLRHSSGRAKRDLHASPLPVKDRRTCIELLMQWILKIRSDRCEPYQPRFPEPTCALSPKAAALRDILREAHPVGVQGPELYRMMRKQGHTFDEYALKRVRKELDTAGCPIGNLRGRGYYLVADGAPKVAP